MEDGRRWEEMGGGGLRFHVSDSWFAYLGYGA